jgi:hypothetical protein
LCSFISFIFITVACLFHYGQVILLYKKNDRAGLANWRPISLMNRDEKLLTRILTTKLQPNLASIIGPST